MKSSIKKKEEMILTSLEKKLNYLINVERPRIANEIDAARAQGDLSENAEYDESKNEQSELEYKINQLEKEIIELKTKNIINNEDEKEISYRAFIGSVVIYLNLNDINLFSNPVEISTKSPLGLAILGKTKNQICNYSNNQNTNFEIKILEIKN